MTGIGRAIRAALLALALTAAAPPPGVWAQTATPDAAAPVIEEEAGPPDYKAWERTATRAEGLTEDADATDAQLTTMRGYLVEWRATFQAAQSVNASRIATLRTQIEALGPAPEEGQTEAEEIAVRRTELSDQLARLQAPGIAADEAYRRADGLIREVDRILRERQADELLQLSPTPANPANWPAAAAVVRDLATSLWRETAVEWSLPSSRSALQDNLPLIVLLTVVGLALLARGRRVMEILSRVIAARAAPRWRKIWALPVSLGRIVLPALGFLALTEAVVQTSLLGVNGRQIAALLPSAALVIASANWIASQVFPADEGAQGPFNLSPERRTEGRFHVKLFGIIIAFELLKEVALEARDADEAAVSVLAFPALLLAAVLLFRLGTLLRAAAANDTGADATQSFANRLIGLFGRAAEVIAVIGPILGAIGYIAAAEALIYPAAISLGVLGVLFILQQLADAVWALLQGRDESDGSALVPTLFGFALTLASLPVFAIIWGARPSDIGELWTRFLEGFSIGETQISPTNFLVFVAVFALGYAVTRLIQGALRSSILPKTRLDQGGQTAVLSGLGYVGVFLAALIAINAAGLNLSGLAIVAGALSVGIGFGLQNIVSNFVSGIILLIERPVSEGDWIEVGTTQGIVKSISVRSTRIQTFDRTDVIVPNTDLVAGRVTNWTRYNLTGRLIVPVSVAYGADTRHVERVLREIAEAQPLAVLNPPPLVLFMGFNGDAMLFEMRVILRDVNFQISVRSEINHAILARFAEEGIELALGMGAQAQIAAQAQDDPA